MKVLAYLYNWLVFRDQCDGLSHIRAFCMRHKHHPGKHQDYWGRKWV